MELIESIAWIVMPLIGISAICTLGDDE